MPTLPDNTLRWFDAHLDLAFLAETGRDMHVDPSQSRGRYQPAAVTLPSLLEGGVSRVLATVFTEAIEDPTRPGAETGAFAYPLGNRDAAYVCGMRQLKLYHAWHDAGVLEIAGRPEPAAMPASNHSSNSSSIRAGILIENADPISDPDELEMWVEGGVAAIGLAWVTRGHYACGNGVASEGADTGLSDAGKALVTRMDELGVVHDASHLNDRSLADLFAATDARVIASHSNCRALMPGANQRHLTDDAIREIVRRDGVIGINLCSTFLDPEAGTTGRASIDDCVRHIEHICEIAQGRTHVGMGSDMDGGFAADRLPEGIDRPIDLQKIADALHAKGWTDGEIAGFAHANWARIFPLE